MERRIKAYEAFIAKAADHPDQTNLTRAELIAYHQQMLQNFQHERLIHLLVTLFFAGVSMVLILLSLYLTTIYPIASLLGPYGLTLLVVILTGFYIKHYYFLENHIQNLYKYNLKLLQK